MKTRSLQWIDTRPGSKLKHYLKDDLRTIDHEKTKENQKEKNKMKSFATGVKSLCIFVPRF